MCGCSLYVTSLRCFVLFVWCCLFVYVFMVWLVVGCLFNVFVSLLCVRCPVMCLCCLCLVCLFCLWCAVLLLAVSLVCRACMCCCVFCFRFCYGLNAFPVCDCILYVPSLRYSFLCVLCCVFVYVFMVWRVCVVCLSV